MTPGTHPPPPPSKRRPESVGKKNPYFLTEVFGKTSTKPITCDLRHYRQGRALRNEMSNERTIDEFQSTRAHGGRQSATISHSDSTKRSAQMECTSDIHQHLYRDMHTLGRQLEIGRSQGKLIDRARMAEVMLNVDLLTRTDLSISSGPFICKLTTEPP